MSRLGIINTKFEDKSLELDDIMSTFAVSKVRWFFLRPAQGGKISKARRHFFPISLFI